MTGICISIRTRSKGLPSDSAPSARPRASAPFSAVVFKTTIDRYSGTLSVLRVVSGTLTSDTPILNASSGAKTRVGKLMVLRGEKHEDVAEAGPGDVVAVAKLKDVHTGDVLTAEKGGVKLVEPAVETHDIVAILLALSVVAQFPASFHEFAVVEDHCTTVADSAEVFCGVEAKGSGLADITDWTPT